MTIGRKLTISIAALVALVLGTSYSSLTTVGNLGGDLDLVVNRQVKKMDLSQAMGQDFHELQAAESGAQLSLVNTDPQGYLPHVQRFDAVSNRIKKQIQEIRPLLETAQDTRALRLLEEGLDAWLPLHRQYLELAQKKQLVVRAIGTELREVTGEMSAGADQVASAASQVAASSQALSQAASEQAASLEETSASSEEIMSMTRKNAENAQAAARLTTAVDGKVSEANHSLREMITSMQEINTASDKISRIIKVIDEIAFQTNILALNAAVEAARAGEAGLGFAVVADEVRSLAQRSAQAAKDTAAMIEESIGKSSEGSAKLNQVAQAIMAITESATKVKKLSDEVDLGSQEQTRSMDQIAQAISRMEQVTQETAASAEESASASEQLSSHANTMRAAATRLRAMVDGDGPDNGPAAPKARRQASPASNGSKPAAPGRKRLKPPFSRPFAPMDGGDFKEF